MQEELENLKQEFEMHCMSEEQVKKMKQKIEEAKRQNRRKRRNTVIWKTAAAAAAVVVIFIGLPNTSAGVAKAMGQIPLLGKLVEVVTFRDYQYEDERNIADIEVPKFVVEDNKLKEDGVMAETDAESEKTAEKAQKTVEEINAEIQEITDKIVAEFEENLEPEEGYQNVMVKPEVISTTQDYFTLKLICYQGAGSGAEWDYFYTIDLTTGERLNLKDIFAEGADYLTPISENIKEQMRRQMAEDENLFYWVDYTEVPDWNFEKISEDTSFYINENGNVVISFNEGDVAPMYMGVVEFVIPEEAIADIRK